jgi:hypothetical protein
VAAAEEGDRVDFLAWVVIVVAVAGVSVAIATKRISARAGIGGLVAAYLAFTLIGIVLVGHSGSKNVTVPVLGRDPSYRQLEQDTKAQGRSNCGTPWYERAFHNPPNAVWVSFEKPPYGDLVNELVYDCGNGRPCPPEC